MNEIIDAEKEQELIMMKAEIRKLIGESLQLLNKSYEYKQQSDKQMEKATKLTVILSLKEMGLVPKCFSYKPNTISNMCMEE